MTVTKFSVLVYRGLESELVFNASFRGSKARDQVTKVSRIREILNDAIDETELDNSDQATIAESVYHLVDRKIKKLFSLQHLAIEKLVLDDINKSLSVIVEG